MHKFKQLLDIASKELTRSRRKNGGIAIRSDGHGILVEFSNGRRQYIDVQRLPDSYLLSSVIMRSKRVDNVGKTELLPIIWQRNRETSVVAFDLDKDGRLIGYIEHVAETLQPSELAYYLELLATECDRFEYVLFGHDIQ